VKSYHEHIQEINDAIKRGEFIRRELSILVARTDSLLARLPVKTTDESDLSR
jgi:hypothetical protein